VATPADFRTVRQDLGLALAASGLWVVVVSVASGWDYWHPQWLQSYWWAGAWLAVPLAFRRLAPAPAFWATAVVYPITYVQLLYGDNLQSDFHIVPVLVATFAVTRAATLPPWLVGLVSVGSTVLLEAGGRGIEGLLHRGDLHVLSHPSHALLLASLACAATILGALFHRLATASESLSQRNVELEALQEMRAREAVRSERTRIARELHDVVAHHVSAIVVRAQAADHVGDTEPEAYRNAVRWIVPAGREALDAMRSVVRVLRDDDVELDPPLSPMAGRLRDVDVTAPMGPVPGLADLGAAVERVRGAGLTVRAVLPEVLPTCSPAVGLAVVRVAQEALTNVLVHSRAAWAELLLDALPGGLVLQVRDPGPARPETDVARQRHGVLHMHERAAACGGEVTVGSLPDGTWVVRLAVPYSDG
jgi:signal transduction histidine kinase